MALMEIPHPLIPSSLHPLTRSSSRVCFRLQHVWKPNQRRPHIHTDTHTSVQTVCCCFTDVQVCVGCVGVNAAHFLNLLRLVSAGPARLLSLVILRGLRCDGVSHFGKNKNALPIETFTSASSSAILILKPVWIPAQKLLWYENLHDKAAVLPWWP